MAALTYKTLAESVADAIRGKIMENRFTPGTRIVEQELADEFQTSRGPIREALRQLESEGLVVYVRNAGCSVRTLSVKETYELYMMRANYETLVVRLLHGQFPGHILARMQRALQDMRQEENAYVHRLLSIDHSFHSAILDALDLPLLKKAWAEVDCVEILTSYTPQKIDVERIYQSHSEILEACRAGNVERICEKIMGHYWKTIERLMREEGLTTADLGPAWDRLF